MKRIGYILLSTIGVLVILPAFILFCSSVLNVSAINSDKPEENEPIENVSVKDVSNLKVRVYFTTIGETREVTMDDYIKGVVAAEMPLYVGVEALKAQAVAARTYTFYKLLHTSPDVNDPKHPDNAQICTDYTHCQAWKDPQNIYAELGEGDRAKADEYINKINEAVDGTKDMIITYDGAPIDAVYFSNSGGWTENVEDVWGGDPLPYLKSVPSFGEEVSDEFC
ncbi:MAG: SpoIID/LytB domain-containing protein, partial [Clostridiales bacterium]|nr:SpoIID/LytB domain-containing protein [Clostridiales bacterium]